MISTQTQLMRIKDYSNRFGFLQQHEYTTNNKRNRYH